MKESGITTQNFFWYRFDEDGIRETWLKRYFGFWKFARSVSLARKDRKGNPWYQLVFVFKGRKKPLRIDAGTGGKAGRKIVEAISFARRYAPNIEVGEGYALELIEASNALSAFPSERLKSEAAIFAEARFMICSLAFKKGRKLLDPLIEGRGEFEKAARMLSFESRLEEGDLVWAEHEYERLHNRFPDFWKARARWAMSRLRSNKSDAEQLALGAIESCPDSESPFLLLLGLAAYRSRSKRYQEALDTIALIEEGGLSKTPSEIEHLAEIRFDIIRMQTDRRYRKRRTFWQPLTGAIVVTIVLGFAALIIIAPGVESIGAIRARISALEEIDTNGVDSTSVKFGWEPRRAPLGCRVLSFAFGTSVRKTESGYWVPSDRGFGSAILLESDARKVLSQPEAYKIRYLEDRPSVYCIHPLDYSYRLAAILEHVEGLVGFCAIVLFVVWVWTAGRIKRVKIEMLRRKEIAANTKLP